MKKELITFGATDVVTVSPVENTLFIIDYQAWHAKKQLEVLLAQEGVSCQIICAYKLLPNQILDLVTRVTHIAPNTSCDTKVRGVLYDKAKSTYIGEIVIDSRAQGSSSYLENAALVIGSATHNHTEPILKIEADDVSASHSSFTGRIDAGLLYYLQSRGMAMTQAEKLLAKAFLASVGV